MVGVVMLLRKVTNELKEWKRNNNRKSLVVKGARQVGKTYAIEHFAKQNYKEVLEINFKEMPSAVEVFSGDLDVDTLVMALRFRFPDKKITPGDTIIFLDEIQECEEAITSLKFWTIDGRYDVIASGSMLGIDYKRASSFPVGYVDYIDMCGLDFEEFLWIFKIDTDMISQIRNCFEGIKVIPDNINKEMMKHFRNYIAIGGMPEVVNAYIDTSDYRVVDKLQRDLLMGYQYDIGHFATAEEKIKAEKCYMSLGKQLLDKENHKFQYKDVEKGGRAQKYYSSVEWLLKADIVSICKRVTDIRYDLNDYARDDFFRLYVSDLSLLSAMRDFSMKQQIIENTFSGNTKGGLYETVTANILYKKGYETFFYKKDNSQKEIDFIIQKEGKVIPIEVKSSNSKATSLNNIVKKHDDIETAYKFIDGNMGRSDNGVITAPLYAVMFL